MSSKTFFFRERYSINEMEERIFAEDFIKVFKSYAELVPDDEGNIEINKRNCYRGLINANIGDDDKLFKEIDSCFRAFGRKGDKLNIKLFVLEDFNYTYNDQIRIRIEELVKHKNNIKEVNSLSLGLKDDIYLEDIKGNSNKLDFKFRFEQVTINATTGVPFEEIKTMYIECRLYLSTGIVAVFNPNNIASHTKNTLSIIHLLFTWSSAKNHDVSLGEAQLIMINLRLNGEVSSPRFTSTQDDLRIEISGLHQGNQENPFVKFVGESHLEIYELMMTAVIHGHNCTVKLNHDGKIQIETFVTPEVLDNIIAVLDWVIFTENYYTDYHYQLDTFIKQTTKGTLQALRTRKIKKTIENFEKLITSHIQKFLILKELKLVTTIVFNIGIQLMDSDNYKYISDKNFELDNNDVPLYTEITDLFSKYMIFNKGLNKSNADEKALLIITYLRNLIVESNGDGVKIIDSYEEWLKCQTQILSTIQEPR